MRSADDVFNRTTAFYALDIFSKGNPWNPRRRCVSCSTRPCCWRRNSARAFSPSAARTRHCAHAPNACSRPTRLMTMRCSLAVPKRQLAPSVTQMSRRPCRRAVVSDPSNFWPYSARAAHRPCFARTANWRAYGRKSHSSSCGVACIHRMRKSSSAANARRWHNCGTRASPV